MTPKEKAEELILKFQSFADSKNYGNLASAKQCALIAVDEIIATNPYKAKNYWQEVKQEIEKI